MIYLFKKLPSPAVKLDYHEISQIVDDWKVMDRALAECWLEFGDLCNPQRLCKKFKTVFGGFDEAALASCFRLEFGIALWEH